MHIHVAPRIVFRYQTEDGLTKIEVESDNDTVWLTQDQMAENPQ